MSLILPTLLTTKRVNRTDSNTIRTIVTEITSCKLKYPRSVLHQDNDKMRAHN